MINIFKACFVRLLKNIYYRAGLLIAAVVTFLFTSKSASVFFLKGRGENDIAVFISIAMVFFFSIFVPVFLGAEYAEGSFRNKLICGYSQLEVYLGNFLALSASAVIMIAVWFVFSLIGGAALTAELAGYLAITVFYIIALISFLTLIGLRAKKVSSAVMLSIGALFISYNMMIFGNALMMNAEGTTFEVLRGFYNITGLGQWFSSTCFYDEAINAGNLFKIVISLLMIVITSLLGIAGINKRDVN